MGFLGILQVNNFWDSNNFVRVLWRSNWRLVKGNCFRYVALEGSRRKISFGNVRTGNGSCFGFDSSRGGERPGGGRLLLSRGSELFATSSDNDSSMLQNAIEQVEKMRVSAIKAKLTNLGIWYGDCFEKRELVIRLSMALVESYKSGVTVFRKQSRPLAQLPITRLRSTANSPKNYILVPLNINNQGNFNFILDTASTVTLINPAIVYNKLRLTPRPAQQSVALLGGGVSNQNNLSVDLSEVKLGNHLMSNVSALLMDQNMLRGWDPSVAGLLGLNVLSQFDVEFEFSKEVLTFHSQGAVQRGECDILGLEKLLTCTITLGLLGVKVALGKALPEVALLDLGSALCVADREIAKLAGVPEIIINGKQPALGGGGLGQLTSMQFSSACIDITMMVAKKEEQAANKVDSILVRGAQFGIGEIPALKAMGCRILLGVNVFQNSRMIFSQSTSSVFMQVPKV